MDFFRNDELLPVWNHDDENEYSTSPGNFEGFWPITGTTSDEDNSASSDAMFVDSGSSDDQLASAVQQSFPDNYANIGYSSSSESFSASTEDFTQLQEQQAQQQYQLEQQIQFQQLHLQQLQYQQQQQQLQYQTQYVQMGYQYAVPQQQYYPVEAQPEYYQQQQPQQQQEEYYQHPQQQAVQSENYEEDVQYDNAYEDDDEQYDTQYEEQSYNAPSSPSTVSSPSAGFVGNMDVDSDPVDFKLPASKTPIMEAMVVCALNGWGLAVVKSLPNEVVFRVSDFDRYYRVSRAICSKHRPTDDVGSRVKTLRRWFVNFPKKKDRQENPSFLLSVKPNTCKKVHGIIERNVKLMTGSKRSSR